MTKASLRDGDHSHVVAALQLTPISISLCSRFVVPEQPLAQKRQDVEEEATAHDQADHDHPVLPSHRDHCQGGHLEATNKF